MFAELDVHRTGCVSVHHIASALTSHGASEKGAALAADAMDLHRDGKIEHSPQFDTGKMSIGT
eukprot:2670333-Amphidinium_carterae.1